jgi:hypothetical protein
VFVILQKSEIIQRSLLPSDDSKLSNSLQRPSPNAQPNGRAAQQRQVLADLEKPPIDWSLKTRALFYSRQPFNVCKEAIMAPSCSGKHRELSPSLALTHRTTAWLAIYHFKPPGNLAMEDICQGIELLSKESIVDVV